MTTHRIDLSEDPIVTVDAEVGDKFEFINGTKDTDYMVELKTPELLKPDDKSFKVKAGKSKTRRAKKSGIEDYTVTVTGALTGRPGRININ